MKVIKDPTKLTKWCIDNTFTLNFVRVFDKINILFYKNLQFSQFFNN